MRSDREGLDNLIRQQYSKAVRIFGTQLNDNKNSNYYYAVSRLGEWLAKLVKNKNSFCEDKNELIFTERKLNDRLKYTSIKSSSMDIQETAEELQSIQLLFEKAKSMQPSIQGIGEGIAFVRNLLEINRTEKRINEFVIEFIKFQVLYSAKLCILKELNNFEKKYFIHIFIPKPIKNLREIIDINKNDCLYLSPIQINQLYKLYHQYHHNLNYGEIFELIEKCLLLVHHHFYKKNNEYLEIWKKFKGNINFEKIMLVHTVYRNKRYHPLCKIIVDLNEKNLFDDMYLHIKEMLEFSHFFWDHVKCIEKIITNHSFRNNHELLTILFQFSIDNIPNHFKIPVFQFNKYLSFIKTSAITENHIDIKKIYTYVDLLKIFQDSKDLSLSQICDMMEDAEHAVGSKNFNHLCEKTLQYAISKKDFVVLMHFALQLRKTSIQTLLVLIDKYPHDIDSLKYEMKDVLLKEYQLKYPERPLQDVIMEFKTKSHEVEYPLDEKELIKIENQYLQIKAIGEKLLVTGWINIQSELKNCYDILKKNPQDETAHLTFLAIIRLQIMDNLEINPYNIQMLNLLALINEPRRIAQIKTGEGKSILIAMLAAYYGLTNHVVDIITTSDDLAIRDAKKFEAFYHSLDLTVGHSVNQKSSHIYNQCIVYGTICDFEFAYLRGETQGAFSGRRKRPYDVAIVDEVDSMFIDMQRNQSILSRHSDEGYQPEVYHTIWHWIENSEKMNQTKENLQAELKSKGVDVDLELAKTWLSSALTAQIYSENKEYIIASDNQNKKLRTIKIVDKLHTGQVASETTRWQGGLHQILEAKHQLPIRVETLTTGAINHIEYFNKYKILTGMTGTLGSKYSRDELKKLYKVNSYDSPPYLPSLKIEIPHFIEKDEQAQLIAIEKKIQEMTALGRPTLIICEDIQQSETYYKYLSKENSSTQIYNGIQTLSAEAILILSGRPGVPTIATNCAGRGTDIVTTLETELHGGLHVILTFPAINLRVERQAFGRTGRQGKKGTYHYILRENQLSHAERKCGTIEEKIALMHENREHREEMVSNDNIFYHNLMHKLFILQNIFFALPSNIKETHMVNWAKWKTDSQKYATRYMRYELDETDDNIVIQNILENFNIFWTTDIATYDALYKKPIIFAEYLLKKCLQQKNHLKDEYTQKLLIETILFFENPKFVFSGEFSDTLIEIKTIELSDSLLLPPEKKSSLSLSTLFSKLPASITHLLPTGLQQRA